MKKLFAILFSFQLILTPVALANTGAPGNEVDAYRTTGNGGRGGYDFYLKQLMTLGSGIIGTNTLTGKPDDNWLTLSPYIFGAGAVALLSSEIAGAIEKNKFNEKKMKELKLDEEKLKSIKDGVYDAESANMQVTAIEKMIEQEKDNKKFLEKRKKWHDVVEVAYWSAVAMTVVEIIFYVIPDDLKPYDLDPFDYNQKNCSFKMNEAGLGKSMKGILYLSYFAAPHMVSDVATNRGKATIGAGLSVGASMLFGVSRDAFTKALDKFTDKVDGVMEKALKNPFSRAITFGTFAGLASTVSQGLKDRIKIANENIEKLEKVKAELKGVQAANTIQMGDGDQTVNPNTGSEFEQDPKKPGMIKGLASGWNTKNCFGKCNGGLNLSSKIKIPNFNLPVISNAAKNTFGLADALANEDAGSVDLHAGELMANAARIRSSVDELMAQANEKLKKEGKKPFDLHGEIKKQMQVMAGEAHSASDLAGIQSGGEKVDLSLASKEVEAKSEDPVVTTSKDAGTASAIDTGLLPLSESESSMAAAEASESGKAGQSLDEFETNEQDINKRPEVSIFKQLSNRYILNYTKMFDRKKGPEVIEEPNKN